MGLRGAWATRTTTDRLKPVAVAGGLQFTRVGRSTV